MVEHGGKNDPSEVRFWMACWSHLGGWDIMKKLRRWRVYDKKWDPQNSQNFLHHFFLVDQKIHPLCVLFSKKRRKQPCEQNCLKEQFGLAFQNLFGCLFVCLFVCFQAISRANAWLPHLGVEPSRVVRVTQQLPTSPPAAQLPSGVSLRMWTQSRCPRTGGWIFAHEKVGQLEVKD